MTSFFDGMRGQRNYVYNFDPVTLDCSPKDAMAKIEEEVSEFRMASKLSEWSTSKFNNRNIEAAIELFDVIHACETMLRMYDQRIINAAKAMTFDKNAERGYYKSDLDILVSGECREDCPWLNKDTNACDRRAREVNDGQ